MDELQELRGRIDAIDAQITALFAQRMDVTERVGRYKLDRGLPVLDRAREEEVLAKKGTLAGEELRGEVTALYETIMALSRRQQQRLISAAGSSPWPGGLDGAVRAARAPLDAPRVLYQGVPGAYSEEATAGFFGEDCRRENVPAWEDVFAALRAGHGDYGVLPIENSSTGSINQVYDLLAKYGAYIVGEQTVRVNHCLMAPRGATLDGLRNIYSHEQGLLQCGEYLRAHPGWKSWPTVNTAAAAKSVAEGGDVTAAAIGSRRAAALYGLEVLAEGVNSNDENFTRFVVVSPVMELRPGREKISALLTLSHRTGALHRVLSVFAQGGLNLLKLESRPIPGHSWEYRFFVDFTGDLTAPGMEETLREAAEAAEELRVLGNY